MKNEYEHPNSGGTEHFDWMPGGMALLGLIKNKIRYYGGERRLYGEMVKETRPILTMPNKEVPTTALSIVINNWNKETAEDIGKRIGRTASTVHRKVKQLGLTKNRATSYSTGQQLKLTQWVLNLETGIYYENMAFAARVTNIKKRTFQQYLTGARKNKTNFILLNNK